MFGVRSVATLRQAIKRCYHGQRMRFVQFEEGGRRRVGVELRDGGDIVDVCAGSSIVPTNMKSFLEGGYDVLLAAKRWVV